jgi:signal transduction histidine kinase
VSRLLELGKKYWFDALVLAGIGIGISAAIHDQDHVNGPEGPIWADVLLMIAFLVPLLFRRRFPLGALIVPPLVIVLGVFIDGTLAKDNFICFVGGLCISAMFGMRPDRRQAIGGLSLLYATAAVVEVRAPNGQVGDFLWTVITFGIVWVVGFALGGTFRGADAARRLAQQAEQEREEQAGLAVAEERARIARELHDVVGHSVSVMTVQAAAVRRLLEPDQEKEREALLVVEQTGREALAEMRRMVGVLRRPEEAPALAPQPSLEHLDQLLATTREAGLPVQLKIEGTPTELPPALDTTAYRIVQEALTNAVKHANAERAEVVVRYGNGTVELIVSDDGRGNGDGGGSGHGLVGMRERVSVYGGELEAGPQAGGGFRLRATLPVT